MGGSCSILARCGEWWGVAVGGGVTTNNDLVNATPRKEAEEGAFILCLIGGVGRVLIRLMMVGWPCNYSEHR